MNMVKNESAPGWSRLAGRWPYISVIGLGSLLAAIDRTVTGPGARLLAGWLAAPSTDPREIGGRLDYLGKEIDPLDEEAVRRAAEEAEKTFVPPASKWAFEQKIGLKSYVQKVMPIYAGFFLFMIFASIGLPGLNGFVGEFLILIGSYATLPVLAIIAASGVILAAIYLLWAYERVFTGIPDRDENKVLSDLTPREISILAPLAVLVVVIGLYPNLLLDKITPSTEAVLDHIEEQTDFVIPERGRLDGVYLAEGS